MQETQEMKVQSLDEEDTLEKKKWQPIPVFLPRKSYGQRSLVGYGPWVKKLDVTEQLSTSKCLRVKQRIYQEYK